jgi:hypothetical protein
MEYSTDALPLAFINVAYASTTNSKLFISVASQKRLTTAHHPQFTRDQDRCVSLTPQIPTTGFEYRFRLPANSSQQPIILNNKSLVPRYS